ncbi:uncharacterized protein TNCV_4497731 [Trichonephila clavipes]|nr:uncharacterized protein TNCV_4497731 [Trichonephila clavipes]
MRICDRWMQEGTTDRCGRSHSPQCTTSRVDRQIVHMAVADCLVTSRTIAQHIEPVTHHSVSVHSTPFTAEWSVRKTSIAWSTLDAEPQTSPLPMTPWRENAEQLCYALPRWSCTGYYGMGRYWILLSHLSSTYCRYRKQPALHLRGVVASCPSLPSGLGQSHGYQLRCRPRHLTMVRNYVVRRQKPSCS